MSQRHRIMVVDDNEDTRVLLKAMLGQQYEVAVARDGVDALEKIETCEPDVFILDISMPVMDGFDTCVAIRRIPRYANALVVFLSGVEAKADIKKTFELGGNYFISKPFTSERILRNLAMLLESAAPPAPKQYTMAEIADMERRGVTPPRAEIPPPPPPRPRPAPAAPQAPQRAVTKDTVLQARRALPRLMIVDDDEDIQFVLGAALRERFEIVTANDGRDAVSRIMDIEPDLLLLDISMPRMNGYELCASLRRTKRFADLPIIFLSANTAAPDIKKAKDVGGTDFVGKPCAVSDVEKALDRVVKSPDFTVRLKRFKIERLLDLEHLHEEKKRARLAQQSVDRDYGGLRKFIAENFMKDLK